MVGSLALCAVEPLPPPQGPQSTGNIMLLYSLVLFLPLVLAQKWYALFSSTIFASHVVAHSHSDNISGAANCTRPTKSSILLAANFRCLRPSKRLTWP